MTAGTPPTRTAAEIASAVGGRVVGDPHASVTSIAPLDRATAGDLSFLASAKYTDDFARTGASVVLVAPEFESTVGGSAACVIVAKPHDALLSLIPTFYRAAAFAPGVHPTAVIDPSAVIGADCRIEPYVVIGAGSTVGARCWIGAGAVIGDDVILGDDVRLYPQTTVYGGTRVGDRSTLHAGVRVGGDGFGYVYRDGAHTKIPHVGRCIIGRDVEIGANSAIDRGSIDDTVIGDGTKLDNLVHVGHNVRIGRLCLLMAQVGVAGSSRIEDGAILAGQVGIAGHLTVGAQARLAAQAGVISDVPAGETWGGYPARPHRESLRAHAAVNKLVKLLKPLEQLLDRESR
jgi:UDP-3-O-[3-hydroxymyristoyl] glucosamine N-acyltransferase